MASRFGPEDSTFLLYLKIIRINIHYLLLKQTYLSQVFKIFSIKLQCFKNGNKTWK